MICVTCYVALDQITKIVFSSRDFFIFPIHIHLVKNYGLSFGLNFGTIVNSIVIVVAIIIFTYYLFRDSCRINWGAILILAGASSNLIDRLVFGFVRDFIDIGLGFTFNLADLFIFLGLIALLLPSTRNNQEQVVE